MNAIQTIDEWIEQSDENKRMFHRESFILDVTEGICAQMQEQGTSRAQLAERLGTTKSFVSQVLNGHRNMTLGTLADIAFALEIQVKVQFCNDQWENEEYSSNVYSLKGYFPDSSLIDGNGSQPNWQVPRDAVGASHEQERWVA
jgi:transcriptional regulator with XRE-family HTH domain